MKSVFRMIMVFIGLYIVASSDIMDFFAHKAFLYVAIALACLMLVVTVIVIGTPFSKPLFRKRGKYEKEDIPQS